MMQEEFSGMPLSPALEESCGGPRAPRVNAAQRGQVEWTLVDLEAHVPIDHPARTVWAFVESADLAPWYADILAVEGHRGRNAIDPKVLMALWLYAILDGVGSARRVDALCRSHAVYQWLCGGVSVNYHALADFRTAHVDALDALLTQSVAALMREGLVSLKTIAQDGKRVRASAGAASFRRVPTLKRCLNEAKARIKALHEEFKADPSAASQREQSARKRAARERSERVARALELAKTLQAKADKANGPKAKPKTNARSAAACKQCTGKHDSQCTHDGKKKKKTKEVRVSTTDPEARVMKMADGGFRPAVNIQYATDTESYIIAGVEATHQSDPEQLLPMHEQLQTRYGRLPERTLVDGSYATRAAVTALSQRGVEVYAPPRTPRDPSKHSPYDRRPEDTDEFAALRKRMSTEAAQTLYRQRAATAELINAQVHNRGFHHTRVRTLLKTKSIALLHALAHNLLRAKTLRGPWVEAAI